MRIAAAGDLHCTPEREHELAASLRGVSTAADVLLLAGDLTTCGDPAEAAALARVCATLGVPTFAVLGNHDWHSGRPEEVVAELSSAMTVLQGEATTEQIAGCDLGIVGTKGFVGGFAGHSHLDDFGEPALRALYREAGADVAALERGLHEIALCRVRIVLLHYSPVRETLIGEPEGIWAFLGNDRLAAPIHEHQPDLVLHGHAHAGALRGDIGDTPVHNVSMPLLDAPYAVFELQGREPTSAALH